MTINTSGNLKDYKRHIETKSNHIYKGSNVIASESQVRPEEIKVKLKLIKTCKMLAILYGLEVLEKIMGTNIAEIDEIQINGMKQILPLSNSTSNTVILTETEIGPVNKKLECCTMMMCCRIMNSDDQRIAKENNKQTTKYRQLKTHYMKELKKLRKNSILKQKR